MISLSVVLFVIASRLINGYLINKLVSGIGDNNHGRSSYISNHLSAATLAENRTRRVGRRKRSCFCVLNASRTMRLPFVGTRSYYLCLSRGRPLIALLPSLSWDTSAHIPPGIFPSGLLSVNDDRRKGLRSEFWVGTTAAASRPIVTSVASFSCEANEWDLETTSSAPHLTIMHLHRHSTRGWTRRSLSSPPRKCLLFTLPLRCSCNTLTSDLLWISVEVAATILSESRRFSPLAAVPIVKARSLILPLSIAICIFREAFVLTIDDSNHSSGSSSGRRTTLKLILPMKTFHERVLRK
jgi:hypothetical protein